MEEWLLDFLKVGVLPLVGVFGGLIWSGRREDKIRKKDKREADAMMQRHAVADFLSQIRELNRQWYENPVYTKVLIRRAPSQLRSLLRSLIESREKRNNAVAEIGNAIDVLYLKIFEPSLIAELGKIEEVVNSSHQKYLDISSNLILELEKNKMIQETTGEVPPLNNSWQGNFSPSEAKDLIQSPSPFSKELEEALTSLRVLAGDRLQIET